MCARNFIFFFKNLIICFVSRSFISLTNLMELSELSILCLFLQGMVAKWCWFISGDNSAVLHDLTIHSICCWIMVLLAQYLKILKCEMCPLFSCIWWSIGITKCLDVGCNALIMRWANWNVPSLLFRKLKCSAYMFFYCVGKLKCSVAFVLYIAS